MAKIKELDWKPEIHEAVIKFLDKDFREKAGLFRMKYSNNPTQYYEEDRQYTSFLYYDQEDIPDRHFSVAISDSGYSSGCNASICFDQNISELKIYSEEKQPSIRIPLTAFYGRKIFSCAFCEHSRVDVRCSCAEKRHNKIKMTDIQPWSDKIVDTRWDRHQTLKDGYTFDHYELDFSFVEEASEIILAAQARWRRLVLEGN